MYAFDSIMILKQLSTSLVTMIWWQALKIVLETTLWRESGRKGSLS